MGKPDPAGGGNPAAVAALLGAVVSFQFGGAIAKGLLPLLGPFGTVGMRILLSAAMLWILWRPWRSWPGRAAWQAVIPYGLSMGGMNCLFYLSLARLPLGPAVAIEFTGPLALAFLGSRRAVDLLWALLVVAGLALLLAPTASVRHLDPLGAAFALGAGLFWAVYILVGQRAGRMLPGGQATALGLAVTSLALAPFCIGAMLPVLHAPRTLAACGLLAILSSALPYSLEMFALRRMSTRGFGVLMSLDPALAALAGLLLLGEQLSVLRWLAILCIVLASLGSVLNGEARKPAVEL